MPTLPSLEKTLSEYDKGLHLRWSDSLRQWCIERRHGGVGDPSILLGVLHRKWKRLEEEDALSQDARAAYDEFLSRQGGYQPILYFSAEFGSRTEGIMLILWGMDIRAAGGPEAWAQKHKDSQETATKVLRMQRRERLRAMAEQAYDRVAVKKDFHAQGGDPFFYETDRVK